MRELSVSVLPESGVHSNMPSSLGRLRKCLMYTILYGPLRATAGTGLQVLGPARCGLWSKKHRRVRYKITPSKTRSTTP